MRILELTIQHRIDMTWPVVVEYSQAGSLPIRSEGVLHFDSNMEAELKTLELLPSEYGTVLGQALFRDGVRDAFMQARVAGDDTLRLLLVVEASDLKSLRWERLCAPRRQGNGWTLLNLDQQVLYSLYLPSLTDRSFPAISRRDLETLMLVADPAPDNGYGLASFDAAATVGRVQGALGEIPNTVLANVSGASGPPTLNNLCEQLSSHHFTLLHIVAHGTFHRRSGDSIVYLLDANGEVSPVTATRLLERLDQLQGARGLPHLVFLSTCESASAEAEGALGGLAQRLVRELGMPAVVAMTEKVSMSTAEELARQFYERLRSHGEVDRALVEAGAALADAGDIVVPALYSRLGGRPLFSDMLDRELTESEIEFGLAQMEKLLEDRAPVLLDSFETLAATIRRTLGADLSGLSEVIRHERMEAMTAVNALCEEVLDLNFRALALDQPPPDYNSRCPFPGLYAFRTEDKDFFFGREALVSQLQALLDAHPFLAVLGASGSGKSSLVLAGLLPAMEAQTPELITLYMTPGSDPEAQLEHQLNNFLAGDAASGVVVVDQFEELFTLCSDAGRRERFLKRLLPLSEDSGLKVVLTMRADFWGECAAYPALKAKMQAHQELLPAMNISEMRSAMERQAAQVGLRFEADLSHTILKEVQDEPGAMPLLQHVLQELWRRRHGRWLKTGEYRALGGIQEAIAHTADAMYEQLSPVQQEYMRNMFVRLTRLGDETGGEEMHRDTRQRVQLEELMPVGEDMPAIRRVVARCADAHLVVTSVDGASGETFVEVAHEALIRHWPRLRGWLDEDRSSLRLLASINEASEEWVAGGRADELLPRWSMRLEEAALLFRQARFGQNALERDYLEACRELRDREQAEREERERREREALEQVAQSEAQRAEEQTRAASRIKKWFVGAVVVGVIAIGLGLWALVETGKAQAAKQEADIKTAIAKAAQGKSLSPAHPVDGLVHILAAVGIIKKTNPSHDMPVDIHSSLFEAVPLVRERDAMHTGSVTAVGLSADGLTVASGGAGQMVRLWDQDGYAIGGPLQGHTEDITSLALSADGGTVVSGSGDKTVRLWDREGGAIGESLKGHTGRIRSVALSADGQTIVSGSEDKTVRLWNRAGEAIGNPFEGHDGWVTAVALSADGQTIVSGSDDKTLRLWTRSGQAIGKPFEGHRGRVTAVALSADAQTIVSAGEDHTVRLWERTGKPIGKPFQGHAQWVGAVALSADGSTVVSGSDDHTVRLWDREGNTIGRPLIGHAKEVIAVGISPDKKVIFSGSKDGTVRFWDREDHAIKMPFHGHAGRVTSVGMSKNGDTIVSGSEDQTVRLWDRTGQAIGKPFEGHTKWITSVAISADGATIVSGSTDHTVRLWDRLGQAIGKPFEAHTGWVLTVAISADGQTIVSGGEDHTVRLSDRSGKAIGKPFEGHTGWIKAVAISADGQTIVSAGKDLTVRLWDRSGRLIGGPFTGHERWVNAVALSRDGEMIISGSADRTVRLWDRSGEPLGKPFKGNMKWVNTVAVSADGETIVSGGEDRMIWLWDRAGQVIAGPFRGHGEWINDVEISEDGQTIISASSDHTLRLWDREGNPIGKRFDGHSGWFKAVSASPDGMTPGHGKFAEALWHWHIGVEVLLERACTQLQGHSVLKKPKTDSAEEACTVCRPIWERQPKSQDIVCKSIAG